MSTRTDRRAKAAAATRAAIVLATICFGAHAAIAGDRVKVGAAWSSSDLPLLFALDKGYFREEDLDVEAIHFDSGAKMVAPLATGDLDVSGGATSAARIFTASEPVAEIAGAEPPQALDRALGRVLPQIVAWTAAPG